MTRRRSVSCRDVIVQKRRTKHETAAFFDLGFSCGLMIVLVLVIMRGFVVGGRQI